MDHIQTMPPPPSPPPPQLQPLQDTYKSCDSCTMERVRCDGLLSRCRLHIQTRRQETTTPHREDSVGTMPPMGPAQLTSGGGMPATPREQSVSNASGVFSLKRCRLSASPATGLVGMQENAFLSDYFECLGFFPLASESMVRQAMVNIMLGSMPQQRQERFGGGAGGLVGRGQAGFARQGHDGLRGQVLARQGMADYPSKCIFWCAIALGALVQGCSSVFVLGYLKLARDSLAECFDGTTAETARAYLVMAFVYRFLGDKEKNQKNLAFAKSIVERLPQDAVALGMENMILAQENESSFIHSGCSGSSTGVKAEGKTETCKQVSKGTTFVHERELCNFYFLADRYMHNAFMEDIRSFVGLANMTGEAGCAHGVGMEGDPVECQVQENRGRMNGTGDLGGGRLEEPLQPSVVGKESGRSQSDRNPPAAGGAIKKCINDLLPEMAIRVAVIEKPGTCSGVGRFVLHGCMAYLKAVKGEMRGAFESMKVCAEVLMRFPGICRYRPHLVHSILTASASSMCRDVYDPVREIYNSILPWNGTPAPPMEDWGGMSSFCNNVLCRSLLSQTNRMDFSSNNLGFSHARAIAASLPMAQSSAPATSPATAETDRPLNCRGCGAHYVAASMGEAEAVAMSRFADGAPLPPPTLAHISSYKRLRRSAGGGAHIDAGSTSTAGEMAIPALYTLRGPPQARAP